MSGPAYDGIRAAIVEGRYAPGERLVEVKLADELQVSRTPVREALRRLEVDGLVVIERNRGAMVRPITLTEVIDLYELRGRLESYAAELAAERATAAERERLLEAAEAFSILVPDADDADDPADDVGDDTVEVAAVRRLSAANRALHDTILIAAHHARLGTLLSRAVDVPMVFRAFRRFGPAERRRSDLFHQLIVEAIVAGEASRASRLMAEHVALGRDAVTATWPS